MKLFFEGFEKRAYVRGEHPSGKTIYNKKKIDEASSKGGTKASLIGGTLGGLGGFAAGGLRAGAAGALLGGLAGYGVGHMTSGGKELQRQRDFGETRKARDLKDAFFREKGKGLYQEGESY